MRERCPLYPNSGHVRCNSVCPLCANSGHCTWVSDKLRARHEQAAQTYQIKIGNRSIFVSYSCSARKVSQLATFLDFKPVMNQRVRCAEEPCVNASGTT